MSPVRPHFMEHPGPVSEQRIVALPSAIRSVSGPCGESGQSLAKAISVFSTQHGIKSAVGTIRNCGLSKTRFTTGGPARDGRAANYTWIREFGPTYVSEAVFTLGVDLDGEPFVHCHAVMDGDEIPLRSGGHLFPNDCLLDSNFGVELHGLVDVELTQQPDAETLHSVFEPNIAGDNPIPESYFIRLRPNLDVTEALEKACSDLRISNATILPSIGSLNAPLLRGNNSDIQFDDVGMEVMRFSGEVRGGRAIVQAMICNGAGELFKGELAPGQAPICVTAELLLRVD
ncbi:MAG: hypothetical protein AAGI92_07580 [Pseudomonadota bacterium]